MEVRELLYGNGGAPRGLLEASATARGIPFDKLLPFEGRPLRNLYTEGFCGGAVIPLSETGAPANDMHRRFSLRGLAKVRGEWDLVCLALNLKRMGTLATC